MQRPQIDHVEAEQEGAGHPASALVGELRQQPRGGDDGAQVAFLHRLAQARQPGRFRLPNLDQHLGLVHEQKQLATVAHGLAPQPAQNIGGVIVSQTRCIHVQARKTSATSSIARYSSAGKVLRRAAPLQVPEQRYVRGLFVVGKVFQLAQERCLAHAPRADYPKSGVLGVEQVLDEAFTVVVIRTPHPTADDIRVADQILSFFQTQFPNFGLQLDILFSLIVDDNMPI